MAAHRTLTAEGEQTVRLLQSWPKRSKAMQAQMLYLMTEAFRRSLLEHIPTTADYVSYRQSIEVASFGSMVPAMAVRVSARKVGTRQVEGDNNILYVRRSAKMKKIPPSIAVLEKYSPWTLDTLPFTPKRSEARVIVRRVTRNEVSRVARTRRRDRQEWRPELLRHGISVQQKDAVKVTEAIPDVAFEGYRLEFGATGQRGQAHWRPALKSLTDGRLIKRLLEQHREITRVFTDLGFMQWSGWPTRVRSKISENEATKYNSFVQKLGNFSRR